MKKIGMRLTAVLLCVCLLTAAMPFTALAAETGELPVREADVTEPSEGNVLVTVDGTFYSNGKEIVLKRINEIRLEACEEGIVDPETGVALTMDDYKPLKWSSQLEWIAQTRAAEAMVDMGHLRPNGKNCFTVLSGGEHSWAENLAWGNGQMRGIEQWYEEKDDYVNQTGGVTGHYKSLISTRYNYIGLGTFKPNDTNYYASWHATAAEFSYKENLDEAEIGVTGEYAQLMEVTAESLIDLQVIGAANLKENEAVQLSLTAKAQYPSFYGSSETGCTVRSAVWTSSDAGIASVDENGVVTGHKKGEATITATAGGKSASITVKVGYLPDGLNKIDGVWYYCRNGEIDTSFTGLHKQFDTWFYVQNGVLDLNYTGLAKDFGTWFYIENGAINWNYSGLVKQFGTWFYVDKGILNWQHTGLVKQFGTWFYVENSVLDWSYTGLVKDFGTWFYVDKDVLDWKFTGITEYAGTKFYVKRSTLDWNYSGTVQYGGKTYIVKNGVAKEK